MEAQVAIRSPLYALDPDSTGLYVQSGSDPQFVRRPLSRVGRTQTYLARIPLPEAGTTVRYYWRAANVTGRTTCLPSDAPAGTYSFRVARDVRRPVITHQPAASIPAGAEGHWVRVRVEDNSGRVGPVVCRYRVLPDGGEREIALRPRGEEGVFAAEIPTGTLALGQEVRYSVTAWDRATPPNRATIPETDAFAVPVRAGWGLDFEEAPGPFTATGDWAWGEPDDSVFAFSGVRCWGTGLRGPYGAGASSFLEWGPVDLRSADRACLRLRHLYRAEEGRDGGRVEYSDHPTPEWTPLLPVGGYPVEDSVRLGPVYSGRSDDYEEALFPLDRLLGRKVWFRFRFESDGRGQDRGWFLDDIRLMWEQARAEPAAFDAATGEDGKVTLRWEPPIGIDTGSPRFAGYHLYRTVPSAPFGTTPFRVLGPQAATVLDLQVVNGITYRYRLHAVYDEGESPGLAREATPNPGRLILPAPQMNVTLRAYAPKDTTVALRNAGRGELLYQVYLGGEVASLPDVRVTYQIRPGNETGWIPVLADADDAGGTADLKAVEVRQWADSTGRMLEFALRGQEAWADPATEWGGVLLLDTDGDVTTGPDGLGPGWNAGGNIGAEGFVVFGKIAGEWGGNGAPAVFDAGGDAAVVPLPHADLHAAPDRITFSLPIERLGSPERVQLAVFLGRTLGEPSFDAGPDRPVSWLRAVPRGGRIPGTAWRLLDLSVDGAGLTNGTYRACLLFASNDRTTPSHRLPVELRVDRELPPDLAALEFRSLRSGLEGTFRLRPETRPDSVLVERRASEQWRPVPPGRLTPDASGRYAFVERGVPADSVLDYRVRVVEGSRSRAYGPFAAVWSYAPPPIDPPVFTSTEEGVRGVVTFRNQQGGVRAIRLERRVADVEAWAPLAVSRADSSEFWFLDRWSLLRGDGPGPDDVCLYRFQLDTAAEDSLSYGPYEAVFRPPVPLRLALHPPRPTPFRERMLLRLDLPAATRVRLEVFDVDGRRRAVLVQRELPAGVHQVVWDGRDAENRALPTGVYWVRLATDQGMRTVRAVRLR